MPWIPTRGSLLLAFLFTLFVGAGVPLLAQEPQPEAPEAAEPPPGQESPRALVREFRKRITSYAESNHADDLARTADLFELGDIPSSDRERIGTNGARDLYEFDERVPDIVWKATSKANENSPYLIETEFGTLELVRGEDGGWRFSRTTLEAISGLAAAVSDRELRAGAIGLRLKENLATALRDRVPTALRARGLFLEHWQWIALIGLIATALAAYWLTARIVRFVENWTIKRGVAIEGSENHSMARAIGQVVNAAVWMWGLQFLLLPATPDVLLMASARILMMYATVWAVWSLVDLLTDMWLVRAVKTPTKLDDQLIPLARKATKVLVGLVGGLWILSTFDLNISALLAGLGLGGLAFALAAKDTIANLFGSLTILSDKPFQIGDWIRTAGVEGTVERVGFRSTRVRTFYNSVVTVPNSQLITAVVDNMGLREYRRLSFEIGLTYATPVSKLEAFVAGVRELIKLHPYTRKDYFHVYVKQFSASSIDVMVYVFFKCPDWGTELREKERLLLDILRLAEDLGVAMAYPTQELHLIQTAAEEHPSRPGSTGDAHDLGRRVASTIVSRYTGSKKPPPVSADPSLGQEEAEG